MLTACVIHGVGFHKDLSHVNKFAATLTSRTGINTIVWPWDHPSTFPVDPRKTGSLFRSIRDFTWEVIMDFAYSFKEYDRHVAETPKADIYIGHSAGGVLAMANENCPCALMGCPVELVRRLTGVQGFGLRGGACGVLNIMQERDPIAAPFLGADNRIVKSRSWFDIINPVAAHTSYWESKQVIDLVSAWMKLIAEELE